MSGNKNLQPDQIIYVYRWDFCVFDDPVAALLQGGGHRDCWLWSFILCDVWLWFFGSVIMIITWLHGHVMLYSCNLVLVIL